MGKRTIGTVTTAVALCALFVAQTSAIARGGAAMVGVVAGPTASTEAGVGSMAVADSMAAGSTVVVTA